MAFFKITKSASTLKSLALEYLDKDKDQITKKQIELNKLNAKIRTDGETDELLEKVNNLKKELKIDHKNYRLKEKSDVRLSGYIRKECYQAGYGKQEKQDQMKTVLKIWQKNIDNRNRKSNHVGLRRFVFTPNRQEMKEAFNFKYDDYQKVLRTSSDPDHIKENVNQFMDDTVRDFMRKFEKKHLHPRDKIGYAFSVHHDTKNPHVHIYLHPYSERGEYISMNAKKYLRKSGEALKNEQKCVDKLEDLKQISQEYLNKSIKYQKSFKLDMNFKNSNTLLSKLKKIDSDGMEKLKYAKLELDRRDFTVG